MTAENDAPATPWWRDPLLGFVVATWAGLCLIQPGRPPLRGEETRWGRIAYEMTQSADYVVPRQQGELFCDRPPLNCWLIALSATCWGAFDAVSIRTPAVSATLAGALVIFAYARRTLSSFGAAAASIMFQTFVLTTQFCRSAECEAVNTALLTTALLGWHGGYRRGLPAWRVWSFPYAFVALSTLTKGIQGPIYFVAATTAYLLVRRDFRFLFCFGHAAGIAVWGALFGAWWIPFYDRTGTESALNIVAQLVEVRAFAPGPRLQHALSVTGLTLGSLLPWSPVLLRFVSRHFRDDLGRARDTAIFCGVAACVTFPSICLALGSMSRHWMGMYGCVAVLCAIVVDRSLPAASATALGIGWRIYMRSLGFAAALATVGYVGVGFLPYAWTRAVATTPLTAALYLVAGLTAAILAVRSVRYTGLTKPDLRLRFGGFLALAFFVVAGFSGAFIPGVSRLANDIEGATAALAQRLPQGVKPACFGRLDHPFLFYYRQQLPIEPWPTTANDLGATAEYFLYSPDFATPPDAFAWEVVDVVTCTRTPSAPPQRTVVLGRRIPTPLANALDSTQVTRR